MLRGYGYQVRFVEDLANIDLDLFASIEWAVSEIRKIQKAARSGNPIVKPRWPVLILRTPKVRRAPSCSTKANEDLVQGWTGPKQLDGKFIEGSFASHQVPLTAVTKNDEQFALLKEWLEQYQIHDLLTEEGAPISEILSIIPEDKTKRLGTRKETYDSYHPLDLPEWREGTVKKGTQESCMEAVGKYLLEVIKK